MSEAVAIGARDDEKRRATPAIQLVRLRKSFGDVVAVDDIDLEIYEGEFFSLLGLSGPCRRWELTDVHVGWSRAVVIWYQTGPMDLVP